MYRRPVTTDRRNKQLIATEYGRSMWETIHDRLQRAEEHVLAPLDPSDRTRFRELLRTVAVRAQTLDPVTDACSMIEELDGPRAAPSPGVSRAGRSARPPAKPRRARKTPTAP